MGKNSLWAAAVILLAGAATLVVSHPAAAQTQEQHDWCYADDATDAQTIEGCGALIQSSGLKGRDLAIVFRNRTIAYEHTKQWDLGLSDATEAVQLDPNYFEAWDDRGIVYFEKGDYDHALEDFAHSIQLNPSFVYPYGNRGFLYYTQGKYDLALQDFNKAISLDASQGRNYINRAQTYIAMKDCLHAAQDYQKATDIHWAFMISAERRKICGKSFDAFSK